MTATALFVILQNPHREMPDLILKQEEMAERHRLHPDAEAEHCTRLERF